jgi:hypothetical protein
LLLSRQNFADRRERVPHGFSTGGNSLVHARKIAPANVANLRIEYNIRVSAPGRLQRASMRRPEFRVETFSDIVCRRGIIVRRPHINPQNASIIISRSDGRRHGRHDAAIGKQMTFVLDGFDKAGESTARADR